METDLLYSEKKDSLDIRVKKINEIYSAFHAILTTFVNGMSTQVVSEGIQTNQTLDEAVKKCFLPKPIKEFIYKDDVFLYLVRMYGHPFTLSFHDRFNQFIPSIKLYNLIESLQVKFDYVDKSIFDQLLFIQNKSLTIINLKNNKLVNIAMDSNNIYFNSLHYKNYKDHVNRLISEKKININDKSKNDIFKKFVSSDHYYIDAKINFTDKEFDLIMDDIKENSDFPEMYLCIGGSEFYDSLNRLDFLNISDDIIKL